MVLCGRYGIEREGSVHRDTCQPSKEPTSLPGLLATTQYKNDNFYDPIHFLSDSGDSENFMNRTWLWNQMSISVKSISLPDCYQGTSIYLKLEKYKSVSPEFLGSPIFLPGMEMPPIKISIFFFNLKSTLKYQRPSCLFSKSFPPVSPSWWTIEERTPT